MRKHGYAVSDDSRLVKAEKIIACLEHFDRNLHDREVLEIGCGSGMISYEMSKRVEYVVAADITGETLKDTVENRGMGRLPFEFVISDGTSLPFGPSSFDIVVCNHVFEHVIDQQELVSEIYRVLKWNGLCYIATGNKLWPIEPHTKLPFLSYLPKSIANKYAKIIGLDEYDVSLPTYWTLKRILSHRFRKIIDLTPLVVKQPQMFHLTNEVAKPLGSILKRIPLQILQLFVPFSPGWIMIGIKSNTLP